EAPQSESSQSEPSPVNEQLPVKRLPLDPRWLPSNAEGVLSLRPSELKRQPAAQMVLDHTATLWSPAMASFFGAFPFAPDDIRRLTWTTTDLAASDSVDWFAAGLVIVELERPIAERKEWLDGCELLE